MTLRSSEVEGVNYQLYTGETYFDALVKDVGQAGAETLVSVSTMGYAPNDENVGFVTGALTAAAQRGAMVSLTVDNFSHLDRSGIGPIGSSIGTGYGSKLGKRLRAFEAASPNIIAGWANHPQVMNLENIMGMTYMGRSHIKSATVGDRLYVGGISLDATGRLDAMMSVDHPQLAYWVTRLNRNASIMPTVAYVLDGEDKTIPFSEDGRLLVDAGVRGQSVIFDETLDIIDGAEKKLVYASEQFPMGRVAKHLVRAYERGVEVVIASNHPSQHDRYRWAHSAILRAQKLRMPSEFFDHQVPAEFPILHTKAIASESTAMVGSHNLNGIGVALGTAEMNIVSTNPELVKNVGDLVLRQIEYGVEA